MVYFTIMLKKLLNKLQHLTIIGPLQIWRTKLSFCQVQQRIILPTCCLMPRHLTSSAERGTQRTVSHMTTRQRGEQQRPIGRKRSAHLPRRLPLTYATSWRTCHASGSPARRQWTRGAWVAIFVRASEPTVRVWTDHRSDRTSRQSTVPVE